jgi:hypothetical protein
LPFAYYARLSKADQATYRASDAVPALRLPDPAALRPDVAGLREALQRDDAAAVARVSQRLADALCAMLDVEAPEVEVLAVRPSAEWGELHGLYTPDDDGVSRIRLWMRTARHARVVAFRTYLRTLLHELCHHLDLAVLGLAWSFHTEGFFKRESSVFRQLVPEASRKPRANRADGDARGPEATRKPRPS